MRLDVNYDDAAVLLGGRMSIQHQAPGRVQAVRDVSRYGGRCVRSEVRYGDVAAGGPRAETEVSGDGRSRYSAGQTVWYGFSVGLPAGWVNDGPHADIVFQWKNIRDAGEQHKNPDIFLCVKRDTFALRINSDARRISTGSSPTREQIILVPRIDFERGGWHDFVFRIRWSFGADGELDAYHGAAGILHAPTASTLRRVATHRGANMHNDNLAGYLKWGIYKPDWRRSPTAIDRRVVYHDGIRVSDRPLA